MGLKLYLRLALVLTLYGIKAKTYKGWRSLLVETPDGASVQTFRRLARQIPYDDILVVLEPSTHRPLEVALSPESYREFAEQLQAENLQYEIIDRNLQREIDEELKENEEAHEKARRKRSLTATDDISEITKLYPTLEEINTWLYRVNQLYPNNTRLFTMGDSYEGRKLRGIIIGDKTVEKPVIWVESGIHAREWQTIVSLLNLVYRLLTDAGSRDLTEKYTWYLVPVMNPDGYVYSHTDDRMWRKNRVPVTHNCTGVDLNRNWSYKWGTVPEQDDPCTPIYQGPRSFSEPETRNIAEFQERELSGKVLFHMTLHAYGKFWFLPWSYGSVQPDNVNEMKRVAEAGVTAMAKLGGKPFILGQPSVVMYPASGTSSDWVLAHLKPQYCFGMEIRPPFGKYNGFIVHVKKLPLTIEEVWVGISAAVRAI